jgi:tetratricopeptide (TPR) repeat protein
MWLAGASLVLAGCGPATPAEKAQADMQTMRAEQTPDKLLDRGRGFAAVGDTTRAEEYLAAALDAGADPKAALPLLLEVCIQTGRYRAAIQHAENQLRRHPDDVRTRFVLGTLYAAVGDNKQAETTLEQVVEIRPNDSKAHYALAVMARDADNDPVKADKHFREYLRLEPNGDHAEEARASLLKKVPE